MRLQKKILFFEKNLKFVFFSFQKRIEKTQKTINIYFS